MVATKKKQRRKRKKHSREYSLVERDRIRNRISRVVCSAPWADQAISLCQSYGVPPESKDVASALSLYHIYPPPAENTPMKPCRCSTCRGVRLWPQHYIRSSGYSTECAYERMPMSIMAVIEGSVSSVRVFPDGTHRQL